MEIIKVGICLEDRAFAEAMARGLARETSAMRFYLLNRLDEGDFCDLILSSKAGASDKVVQMVRDPSAEEGDDESRFDRPPYRVYRYRESQNLISDLLFIHYKLTGKVSERRGRTGLKMLLFLADSGGCGTTSTALAILRMLYRLYGSRSLYLNLCPLDDSRKYLKEGGGESLLKLLYYLDQEKDFPIESFITGAEELDYVNTSVINTYFSEMKPFLMMRFLDKVEKLGKYDFVAVDIGSFLSKENKKLLGYTDFAVLLSDGQRRLPGKYKERISREIFKRLEKGRMIRVENFAPDDFEEEEKEQEENAAETSEQERNVSRLSIARQYEGNLQLQRNYGMEISAIAREIMEEKDGAAGQR